jgi:hypothetical protein
MVAGMRGCLAAVVLMLAGSSAVALAKGHQPAKESVLLAAPQTFEGILLPKGTAVVLEAQWDNARDQYGPKQLFRFRLPTAIDACGTRLPAKVQIEIRRGIPAATTVNVPPSTAVHVVWRSPAAVRIGERSVPAGSSVGVECSSHQLTLLYTGKAFDVDQARVISAAWYPSELGGKPLWLLLAAPADIAGIHVPSDFAATFSPNGHLLSLLGPSNVGVKVDDRVCWTQMQGHEIRFDESARVTCKEAAPAGVPCDTRKPILLHDGSDSGHLARCTLTSPFQYASHIWEAGAEIRLAPDGHPVR